MDLRREWSARWCLAALVVWSMGSVVPLLAADHPFGEDVSVTVGVTPGNGPDATTAVAPTPAPAAAAPAPQPTRQVYVVQPGDCLWKIAARFLGAGSRYWDIVAANQDRYPSLPKNPNLIHPGWRLVIPGVSSGPGIITDTPGNPHPPAGSDSPTPPQVPAPAAGARGGKALLGWLQQAGLTGENLRMAWSIGMAESSGNPRAHNPNASTGDNSYGLFQINMIGDLGPARRRQYNLSSNEDLFDPMTNIRVMLKMSNNCTNWRPWSVYKRGTYRRFYDIYPPR